MSEGKLHISPKRPKGDDGYKTFSIRIKTETVERVEKLAVASGRSRNELIGMLLDYALDNSEITKN
ncbi:MULTISPECIES: ribbon-helix-helix protein, CopG family [Anaerotruncus]|uniref:CopG family transcriptional regulator n=2 Tax=Anaerotruncus TaxID=244127 RepID=A0A498CYM1_9FIRM|nr:MULTISPECIES: ribbon-helix-helix protein, CopG family [Anaerotruncus]MBC3939408.1 CopG family transcriptional regulator [Anaerotruncus massiliensis (ex Togo et al. 2019)]MCQ4896964.1 ribbon-helix-helix domain-containing protein [Anaerotruncus sp. DFI.9.16]RLL09081.1 CopG family transcriptional regulator [Anaerotruncus massiliensis (ex Liu et al. 2021)]